LGIGVVKVNFSQTKDERLLAFYENIRKQVDLDTRAGGRYRLAGEGVKQYADRLREEMDRRRLRFTPGCGMTEINERTAANMDVVLEEICSGLQHSGNHESRKYVGKKLMQSVKKGNVTLEGLRPVANHALSELSSRKSA
jgi:hypothetical protein